MKFGRLLKTTSLDLPEMEALFSAYKTLKKHVKKLPFKDQLSQQETLDSLSEEENNFCKALSDTLQQLNEVFLAKEENSVIRVERLEHDLAAATTPEQLNDLHKQFVDFHGEVLLLVHWSILAYTATVKILKKHHKRTGLLVKAPQLGNLLSQPFCSTELMTSIAHRVEEDIQRLAERMGVSGHKSSEHTQQQQQQQHAPQTHSAAAAPLAGLPQLAHGEVDLQLLHELADSESITTPSDTDLSHETDTAQNSGSKRPLQQQQQQQQACSQQVHVQDDDTEAVELQSGAKRHRLSRTTAAAATGEGCGPVTEGSAGADAALADADAAAHETQQRENAAAKVVVQQQEAAPVGLLRRCSSTGCNADSEVQQQQQQLQHGDRLAMLQRNAGLAGCSSTARQGSIMRQTQVALTTWRHLQSTASTPSTVMPNGHVLHRSATARTESSAV